MVVVAAAVRLLGVMSLTNLLNHRRNAGLYNINRFTSRLCRQAAPRVLAGSMAHFNTIGLQAWVSLYGIHMQEINFTLVCSFLD